MATDLVERELELAQLAAQLDDALSGEGRTLLIEGPAGVGKTRLLMETRTQAADRGATMLMGRASQLEREFPFGVVRQLFEAALAEPELRDRAMAGAAAPAQAVFGALPEADASEGAVDASFAILHGLYWMTLNLAQEHPLVLAIDDLQWCDRPSLRFIAYLARRIDGLPVLVAATVRTGEAPTDEAMMADISQDPATAYIRPGPLSEAGVGALVADRLGPDAEHSFIAACHRTTGGNPLLVRQLLTALASERVAPRAQNARVVQEIGPRAVSRSVLLRLARMPSETIAVARAVAILGESAELPTVAALAELDDTQAATAIATLARAEILRPEAPLGFVHPLVRDAVYHELPPGEREMQHARAARILHDAGAEAAQVGTHLMAIPRRGDDWVTEVLVEAGRSALRRGATENAVGYMQRALDEPPSEDARPQILFELGLVEALTNAPAAVEHLQAAYDSAPNAQMRAMSAYALARSLLFATSPTAGVDFARRARDETPAEFVDVRQSLTALDAIGYWFGVGDETTPKELERYRGEETAGAGPGARMIDAIVAYDLFRTAGPVDDCARLARRALADDVLVDYDNGLFNIPAMIVLAHSDAPDTLTYWDTALADAYRSGSMFGKSASDGWRGFTMLHLGELDEAAQLLDLAYEGLIAYGYSESIYHYFTAFQTLTHLYRGDLARSREALERVPDLPGQADGPRHWMRANAELLLAENKPEEALEATYELERRCVERAVNPASWPYRSLRGQALARLGRRDEAVELVEEELELARRFGAHGIVGRTLRVLGEVKGHQDGIDDLSEAVELLEDSLCQYERALALAAYGSALRHTRRVTDAREPLRRALELADKCGAPPLAEHARSELYATGARPRTEAMAGVGSLTASERRVADLAAEGNSNRDIAQALFVTPKTVEVHLSNAYRKLGIRGRRELPDVLVGTS